VADDMNRIGDGAGSVVVVGAGCRPTCDWQPTSPALVRKPTRQCLLEGCRGATVVASVVAALRVQRPMRLGRRFASCWYVVGMRPWEVVSWASAAARVLAVPLFVGLCGSRGHLRR